MSGSGTTCSVLGCGSSKRKAVRLFKLSERYTYFEKWLENCQFSLGNKHSYICEKHFERHMIGKKCLKKHAIPTLLLPKPNNNCLMPSPSPKVFHDITNSLIRPMSLANDSMPSTSGSQVPIHTSTINEYTIPSTSPPVYDQMIRSNSAIINPLIPSTSAVIEKNVSQLNLVLDDDFIVLPDPTKEKRSFWFEDKSDSETEMASFCVECQKKENIIVRYSKCITKTKSELNSKINSLKRQINILKKRNMKYRKIIKENKHQQKQPDVLKRISELDWISTSSKVFCKMVLKKRSKTSKWNDDEKSLAQNIYYRSPKTYTFIRDKLGFSLPSKSSIIRWQPVKNLSPGLNKVVIDNLQEQIKEIQTCDRKCVLLFDEISIRKELQYNQVKDVIEGYVDLGNESRTNDLAKHVCLFMVRGLLRNYKFPLAYYATETAITAIQLTELIKAIVELLTSVGFYVSGIVCDQGSNNRKALKLLGSTKDDPQISIGNLKIVSVNDVPHLIKTLRNRLLKANLKTPDGEVSWKVVKELFEIEQSNTTRLCPKLTFKHMFPNHFEKMKVKLATQIFSRSVVAAIKTLHQLNKFSENVQPFVVSTLTFFEKIDQLFDCLNSKNKYDKNVYRCALTHDNKVNDHLNEMLPYFEFIINNNPKNQYCFTGFVQTINGILLLSSQNNIDYLLTSRLNQDPLENYFSMVRSSNTNNSNPSLYEFNRIMAKLMSIKIITKFSNDSNCEEDDAHTILQLVHDESNQENEIITQITTDKNTVDTNDRNEEEIVFDRNEEEIEFGEISTATNMESLEGNAARYYIGYVIKKMQIKFPCHECEIQRLKSTEYIEESSEWLIFYKNYIKEQAFGKLKNPTDQFFDICMKQITIFERFIHNYPEIPAIKLKIMEHCTNIEEAALLYETNNPCYNHNIKYLEMFIKILLFKNCKWISDKMKSKDKSKMPQK